MKGIQWDILSKEISNSLQAALPEIEAHKRMLPYFRPEEALHSVPGARESAVLILLFPNADAATNIVLIQRTEDGGVHSGQIALPGGKREISDPSLAHTALREAQEEIHLESHDLQIVGQLSPLYVNVSNFLITPIVALSRQMPQMRRAEHEVARILPTSLSELFNHKAEEKIMVRRAGNILRWKVPAYKPQSDVVVWGATAMILAELEWICSRWNH